MTDRPPRGERGFALAETLVAAAVIAVMTTLFYQVIMTDADVSAGMRERRAAALLAQSVLAEAVGAPGVTAPAGADMLAWRVARAPYDDGARGGGPAIERVTVLVTSRRTGRPVLSLQTLRLAR